MRLNCITLFWNNKKKVTIFLWENTGFDHLKNILTSMSQMNFTLSPRTGVLKET